MFDRMEVGIISLVGLLILGILGAIVYMVGDELTAIEKDTPMFVVNTQYDSARTSTGVGITSGGDLAVTTSSSPAKYHIIADGHIIRTNKQTFLRITPNAEYVFVCSYGGWSGDLIRCWLP